MSTANKPKLIVAAIACRPYVEAAIACGYDVFAIDAFADAEIRNLAETCYRLEFNGGQLNMHQLMQLMQSLDLRQFAGFCYGAGFEKEPAILSKINTLLPVVGNLEQAVSKCKAPDYFFSLCEQLAIPHPEVLLKMPSNSSGWLRKEIGASGGWHIRQLDNLKIKDPVEPVYYQKFQQGKPISCLFIASNNQKQEHSVQVVGFNEQFISECADAPYRYGGAVSHVVMSDLAKARFEQYINQLSQAIGLVGLNSCDAICDGDDIYLLEINPRLSATMSLYTNCQLLEKHIAATNGNALTFNPVSKKSHAQQIIYAEYKVIIKDDIIWPSWVYDRPKAGSFLDEGMPVCTVVAEAETAEQAKCLVKKRVVAINREFLN